MGGGKKREKSLGDIQEQLARIEKTMYELDKRYPTGYNQADSKREANEKEAKRLRRLMSKANYAARKYRTNIMIANGAPTYDNSDEYSDGANTAQVIRDIQAVNGKDRKEIRNQKYTGYQNADTTKEVKIASKVRVP